MSTAVQHSVPRIPDYDLVRLIGSGSYGDVWLARGVTGVFRAVKIVWRDRFNDPRPYAREFEGVTRFAEVSLREPSQLALLHAGRNDEAGFFYYVMELADDVARGREIEPTSYVPLTLKELRDRKDRLPILEVVGLGVALARALSSLHASGLVHRDIKPSNIVLVGGVPKLADVGLVAAASAGLMFVGTEGFVPPEGPGAPSADVFSLGKVLYELATGLDRHDFPRLPPNLAERTDRRELLELNEVLLRACEPMAANRFADATALLDELLLLQAGKSVLGLRNAERVTARARRTIGVLALIAAVAGAGAYLQYIRAEKALADRVDLSRRATYSGNLASAQRAVANEDFHRAQRLLAALIPQSGESDLRGFEWNALVHAAHGDPHEVLRETGSAIDRLALSPDASLLAVHDGARTLTLYDAASRRVNRRVSGMRILAGFSGDGKWLIGTDAALRLTRWSAETGLVEATSNAPRWTPIASRGQNEVVGYSIDDLAVRVWNFDEHREIFRRQIAESPWQLFRTAVSDDGQVMVAACVSGRSSRAQFRLIALSLGDQAPAKTYDLGRQRPSAVGFDRWGAWAVIDTTGEVWRCREIGWALTAEKFPVGARKYVRIDEADRDLRVVAFESRLAWQTGTEPHENDRVARGHSGLLSDLAADPKHRLLFSAAADGGLFCWPLDGPVLLANNIQSWDSNAGATRVVFAPDGKSIWAPLDGTACVRLDLASLRPLARCDGMLYPISAVGDRLLGVAPDIGLVSADATLGGLAGRFPISPTPILFAGAAANADQVLAIDEANDVFAWSSAGSHLVRHGPQSLISGLLNRSGTRAWIRTSTGNQLLALTWPAGELIWEDTLPATAAEIILLPGETYLLAALQNGALELRSATTGKVVRSVDSGSAAPQALAVTPDGTRVFAAGREGDIHCFTTKNWDEVHAFPLGPGVRPHRLFCSPDGRTLITVTKTGGLHVLRAD